MGSSSWQVLVRYPFFRWYILTVICKDIGDWLVRVSNLLVLQEWRGTGTALSRLVFFSLIPKALLSPFGGLIADRFDRRHLMIALDGVAGFIVLGYLLAFYYKSVELLFATTALRSSISALHYPVCHGLVPLICTNNEDMQYAGTMMTSVYGMMSMVGGLFAGYAAATYGVDACYLMDSFTYFLSSAIMATCVSGNFKRTYVEHDQTNKSKEATGKPIKDVEDDVEVPTIASTGENLKDSSKTRFVLQGEKELFHYLRSSGVGMLVFMKATDSLIWGPGDIIGIEMSTIYKPNGSEDESATSYRMGLYYACMGLGVFFGPSVSNYFSDAKRPSTIQRACVIAIFVAGIGWTGSHYAPDFHWFLVFQAISGLAFGTLWSYSTLLLQLLVDDGILGRVFSVEYFLYVMAETISSSATGPLYDAGFSSEDLCLFGASLAFVTFGFWATYHWLGKGAARAEFNDVLHPKKGQPPVDSSIYSLYDIQYREGSEDNKSVVSRASARKKTSSRDVGSEVEN